MSRQNIEVLEEANESNPSELLFLVCVRGKTAAADPSGLQDPASKLERSLCYTAKPLPLSTPPVSLSSS